MTWEKLYQTHLRFADRHARFFASRYPAMNAADLRHAARVGLWQAALNFEEERGIKFATHAYRRVRGEMIDEIRRQLGPRRAAGKLTLPLEDGDALPAQGNPFESVEQADLFDWVLRTVAADASDRDRQVLLLRMEGRTLLSIAQAFGITEARVHQIVKAFRTRMHGEAFERATA